MKPPRKVANFSTSFLDIILGALGAFFLLLILVCVSRRGAEADEKGSRLPDGLLLFRVLDQPNFVFSKHIRFCAAIYDENGSSDPFFPIYFSEQFEDDAKAPPDDPRLTIKSFGASDYQMTLENKEEDASKVLICVWLADWPSDGLVKPLLSGDKDSSISIKIAWTDKDYKKTEIKELNRENGFASVFFLTGRETPEVLARDVIERITYRSFVSSLPNWGQVRKEKILPSKTFAPSDSCKGVPEDNWWLFSNDYEPIGLFKCDNVNVRAGRPNVFLLPSTRVFSDTVSDSIYRNVNDLAKGISQTAEISYVASGKRAICVRFKEDERNLYVYPQDDWKNASVFADCGILSSIEKAPKWYRFNLSEADVERYAQLHPAVDKELVLKCWADAIASPIYETNSPITQASPLVSHAKKSNPSK